MGRIRKKVDINQVLSLAVSGCSNMVIAKYLGISHDTLTRRFKRELEEGRARGVVAIAAAGYDEGVNKRNTQILKHLLENRLGETPTMNLNLSGEIETENKIVIEYVRPKPEENE